MLTNISFSPKVQIIQLPLEIEPDTVRVHCSLYWNPRRSAQKPMVLVIHVPPLNLEMQVIFEQCKITKHFPLYSSLSCRKHGNDPCTNMSFKP